MAMSIEISGDTVAVRVEGQLTLGNRTELQHLVLDALAQGAQHIVVDLAASGYVDSAGLGTLVLLARRARAGGGELRVVNVNDDVRALMVLTKLDTVFGLDAAPIAA
jgi:anti-anti-sigma factor